MRPIGPFRPKSARSSAWDDLFRTTTTASAMNIVDTIFRVMMGGSLTTQCASGLLAGSKKYAERHRSALLNILLRAYT